MKTSSIDTFALERYGHNLTSLVRQGVFPPLVGYEASVARVFQMLLRQEKSTNKYNPLLMDMDEMRRWRVVLEVVRRMAIGEAPDPLPTREVIALNYEALFAENADSEEGHVFVAPEQPQFDESEWKAALAESGSEEMLDRLFMIYFRWPSLEEWHSPNEELAHLQALFLAVRQAEGHIVLFVNHFHWLLGGGPLRYSVDASSLLKPVLARRDVQFIGTCTEAQYRQYIERDAAMLRRFQEIDVKSDEELQPS